MLTIKSTIFVMGNEVKFGYCAYSDNLSIHCTNWGTSSYSDLNLLTNIVDAYENNELDQDLQSALQVFVLNESEIKLNNKVYCYGEVKIIMKRVAESMGID
jgi:hypothetical protein